MTDAFMYYRVVEFIEDQDLTEYLHQMSVDDPNAFSKLCEACRSASIKAEGERLKEANNRHGY